ncbi:serine O-acetyltransferase EpsC [Pedobacter metabolipauper]|nr:serine O-acetyltransferase EpsC [Pedobacter metabolipauper]
MKEEFYLHIYEKQDLTDAVPANAVISDWALNVLNLMFPARTNVKKQSLEKIRSSFTRLENELTALLNATKACSDTDNCGIAKTFFSNLPELYRVMNTDITAIYNGDPAAKSEFEIVRAYPGFLAISLFRIAHALLKLHIPLIPRILTEYVHSITGIDIHPGAILGEYLYIDHGTGIVIGETTIIGAHVKLYQGVTLGALSVEKFMTDTKRHPTIEDHVIIYSGATILGGDTVVGTGCIIGGNVWLTKSVPAGSTVYHQPELRFTESRKTN